MTLIIPPGFANAAFIMSADFGTPPLVTTLGVDVSGFGGDFVTAANEIKTHFYNAWEDQIDGQISLDRVTLSVGSDGPGGSVDSDTAPVAFARSGTSQAYSMSAIVRKTTNMLGRRGRGRMFLPGVLVGSEVDESGNISTARINSLQASADAFYTALTTAPSPFTAPLPPVLLHSQAPTEPDDITGFTVASLVGWVRGRIR